MKKLALMGILSVLAIGCGDDDARGGTDSGLMLMDSGMIVLPDTGTMPMVDAGTPRGECAEPLAALPSEVLPRCSTETAACIDAAIAARDQMALNACYENDMTAPYVEGELELDCGFCSTLSLISCASNNGCDAEWADWNCCLNACTDDACRTQCTNMFQPAFVTCLQGLGATCADADAVCFP